MKRALLAAMAIAAGSLSFSTTDAEAGMVKYCKKHGIFVGIFKSCAKMAKKLDKEPQANKGKGPAFSAELPSPPPPRPNRLSAEPRSH